MGFRTSTCSARRGKPNREWQGCHGCHGVPRVRRYKGTDMKTSTRSLTAATALALMVLVPSGLLAQRGGFGGPMQQERKILAQFDKNGDKRLDAAERKAAREWPATQPAGGVRGAP